MSSSTASDEKAMTVQEFRSQHCRCHLQVDGMRDPMTLVFFFLHHDWPSVLSFRQVSKWVYRCYLYSWDLGGSFVHGSYALPSTDSIRIGLAELDRQANEAAFKRMYPWRRRDRHQMMWTKTASATTDVYEEVAQASQEATSRAAEGEMLLKDGGFVADFGAVPRWLPVNLFDLQPIEHTYTFSQSKSYRYDSCVSQRKHTCITHLLLTGELENWQLCGLTIIRNEEEKRWWLHKETVKLEQERKGKKPNPAARYRVDVVPYPKRAPLTEIGNGFLQQAESNWGKDWGKSQLQYLALDGLTGVTKIGDKFCHALNTLETILFRDCVALESIGDEFLCATATKELSFRYFRSLQKIGSSFCSSCRSLKKVEFTDLRELTEIGTDFLHSAGLESLELAELPRLKTIGKNFLTSCGDLSHFRFPGKTLKSLEIIPAKSFFAVHALKKISLSHFPALKRIEEHTLGQCLGLESVEITHLPKLETVSHGFLRNSHKLTNFKIEALPQLQSIEDDFLASCTSLQSFSLQDMPHLAKIGNKFLTNCAGLRRATFSDLPSLESIGDGYLQMCSALLEVALEDVFCLEKIGRSFLRDCPRLQSLTFSGATSLTSVADEEEDKDGETEEDEGSENISPTAAGDPFSLNASSEVQLNLGEDTPDEIVVRLTELKEVAQLSA